jgi:predicted NAD-dependent protein-ADP-ribosyltransferase YbiA (DUF1768 family)
MEYKKSIREALEYVAEKKAKSKAKFKTTFTPEGDILLSDKDGKQVKTYSLPNYRAPTGEELQTAEQKRRDDVVKAEEEIDKLYVRMREAARRLGEVDDANLGDKMQARSEYLSVMREMEVVSAKYSEAVQPEKRVDGLGRIPTKMLQVERYNDDTTTSQRVFLLRNRPMSLETMFEREGEMPQVIETPAEFELQLQPGQEEKFIPIMGDQWLSPDMAVNFQHEGHMYNSIRQAIEAWKARTGGDYEREMAVLKAVTPADARSLGVPNKEIPTEIIFNMLRAVNQSNSARKTLIRNMEAGTYMYMDTDVILGVGMEGPIEGIKSRENWMGQNRYGLAVTQMIAEVKAMPETVAKRRVVTKKTVPVAPALINPFNMF